MHGLPGASSPLRNRVREERLKRELSQRALAERAGVSHPTIVYLERDDGYLPLGRVMVSLCIALDVSLGELFLVERGAA